MLRPPEGYTLGKSLHTSTRSLIYAATRDSDGARVVLKVFTGEGGDVRARHEHQVVREIQGPGIAEALELRLEEEAPVLVLEAAPGVSLTAWVKSELPAQ